MKLPDCPPEKSLKESNYLNLDEAFRYVHQKFGINCAKRWLTGAKAMGPYQVNGRPVLYHQATLDIWVKRFVVASIPQHRRRRRSFH